MCNVTRMIALWSIAIVLFVAHSSDAADVYFKESDVVFIAGDTRIYLNNDGRMGCSYCGYGEKIALINGSAPYFSGTGSGPQAYFQDRFLLVARTDMGRSCDAGSWYAIDLRNRISKKLPLPNCDEVSASFAGANGQVVVKLAQGKKVSTFSF